MKPSPNRQAVIVGLFVTVAVAILTAVTLTIGDLNDTFTHKVTVTAVFDEVNGLQKGDNIWFSGVKVGIVKRLGFHGGAQVEVEMSIDRSATEFIPGDAQARIGSDGLIGSKLVILSGGTPAAAELADGGVLSTVTALSTDAVLATLQQNNENLLAITTDLRGISGALAKGEGTVGKLLGDDTLYSNVTDTVATLDDASAHAEALTANLSTFTGKLNREGGLPNDLVTDRTTYASLTDTVGKLNDAGASASVLVSGLAQSAANPATPVGALLHDAPAGADLKATLEHLNRGTGLLAEDLEAAQDTFVLRGAFKRRARAEAKALAQVEKAAETEEKADEAEKADTRAPDDAEAASTP